jgi:hypothetical protein
MRLLPALLPFLRDRYIQQEDVPELQFLKD